MPDAYGASFSRPEKFIDDPDVPHRAIPAGMPRRHNRHDRPGGG
jgi:hypothetical protein